MFLMTMNRLWLVAVFLCVLSTTAFGQTQPTCPSPNPNITGKPFVNNCLLPAEGLNTLASETELNAAIANINSQLTGFTPLSTFNSTVTGLNSQINSKASISSLPGPTTCPSGEAIVSYPGAGQPFACAALITTIAQINLSNNAFVGGTASGTVIGNIAVNMSPSTSVFSGTISLSGADAGSFQIVGSALETNGVVPSGNYSINIVATQLGIINSPATQAETIAGRQTLVSVNLSNSSFVSGVPSGTVVGTITVVMSSASPAFSGSLALTGADAGRFQIVGSNLETLGVQTSGTYSINVVATQANVVGSPFTQPETITGVTQTMSAVILSNTQAIGGTGSANELVGTVHVIVSPSSPAFSGSLQITGTNASSFALSGSQLKVGASDISNGSYSINVVATQSGVTGSPITQPETIVAATTNWVNDQTQEMPYVCLNQIWINPSPNASGPTGGGKSSGSGGFGTQAAPFLTAGDLYTSQVPITPGTCVNIINSATLSDSAIFGNGSGFNQPLNQTGAFANAPDGIWVIRGTDNTGALLKAFDVGGTFNSSATKWMSTNLSPNNIGNLNIQPPTDYLLLDGIEYIMDGSGRNQLGLPCVQVGSLSGNNVFGGLTHFWARHSYVHGCGAGGFNIASSDYVSIQETAVKSVAISNPTLQESGISIAASAEPNNYTPTGYDNQLCTTMGGSCQPYHHIISGNLVSDPLEALVPSSTDGNCIIIDTDVNAASSTNAGPYLFRALLVNNVAFNCGGEGIYTFVSQHVDMVNNTVVKAGFDPHNFATVKAGAFCFNTLDCVAANNLVYNVNVLTTVTTTGTGSTLAVDDVSGFRGAYTNSGAQPVSPSNPIDVTVDGIANTVVGLTIDATNTSTSAGGLSGTLTFGTAVSSPHGNSGVVVAPAFQGGNVGNPVALYAFGLLDAQPATVQTCVNWAQPVPCAAPNILSILLNGASDSWYSNLGFVTNVISSLSPAIDGSGSFCPSCAVPPSQTTSPGNNILATDPLLTTPFYAVSPAFELKSVALNAIGNGCVAGEKITLAGGTPSVSAIVQVDAVSNGHIIVYHLLVDGNYPSNSTTSFTIGSTTGSCTGATFSGGSFFQAFESTSTPNISLQGGSPALAAGNANYIPSHNFFGTARSSPPNIGAY